MEYKEYLKKEADQAPANEEFSFSLKLNTDNWQYITDEYSSSKLSDNLSLKDLNDFLDDLKKLPSYNYSHFAGGERKKRCWQCFAWWIPLWIIILILCCTVLKKVWWIILSFTGASIFCYVLLPIGLDRTYRVYQDTQAARRSEFKKLVDEAKKKIFTPKRMEIKNSTNYAWFKIIDNSRKYLIATKEVWKNDIWGDCTVIYKGEKLILQSKNNVDRKITCKSLENLFKLNSEVDFQFHDGSGFNFSMKGKMSDRNTITLYKDGNNFVFTGGDVANDWVINEGDNFKCVNFGEFYASYEDNSKYLRLTKVGDKYPKIQTEQWANMIKGH